MNTPPLGIVARVLVLCATGTALGLVLNVARTGHWPRSAVEHGATCEGPAVEPTALSPAEAAQVCVRERALVADARSDAEYAAGHVAGAVHLPCNARGDVASAALTNLDARGLVLVYGATTEDARTVARSIAPRLAPGAGPKIYFLEGGFSAWERAGLACASGPCEGCVAPPQSR